MQPPQECNKIIIQHEKHIKIYKNAMYEAPWHCKLYLFAKIPLGKSWKSLPKLLIYFYYAICIFIEFVQINIGIDWFIDNSK